MPTSKTQYGSQTIIWLLCVIFCAFPLLVFLVCLNIFASTGITSDKILNPINFEGTLIFSTNAGEIGAISLFNYAMANFIHFLICFSVGLYFLSRFKPSPDRWIKIIICLIFFTLVVAVIYLKISTHTTFRGYMLEPFLAVLENNAVSISNIFSQNGNEQFLKAILLIPTSIGIFVVILASGSFHSRLFSGRLQNKNNKEANFTESMMQLRQDITALSIVLVSSAVTSNVFFSLPKDLFLDQSNEAAKYYDALSNTLSTGSGILFSATLIAAFAPGTMMLIGSTNIEGRTVFHFSQMWSNFTINLKRTSAGLKKIWRSLLTLLAPAIASPLMNFLGGFT